MKYHIGKYSILLIIITIYIDMKNLNTSQKVTIERIKSRGLECNYAYGTSYHKSNLIGTKIHTTKKQRF